MSRRLIEQSRPAPVRYNGEEAAFASPIDILLNRMGKSNQRVVPHRARSKVRQALERYLDGE